MGGHSGCRKRGEVFETSYARTDPVDSCLFKNRANPGLTDFEWVTLFLNINPIRLSNQVFFFLFFLQLGNGDDKFYSTLYFMSSLANYWLLWACGE